MWCPNCQKSYKRTRICPDCGNPLEREWGRSRRTGAADRWPRTEAGEPVTPAFLCHTGTVDLRDELVVNLLESMGIPTLRRFPNDGEFGRVILGTPGGGADVYVPETMLEDALALIEGEAEQDDENIDG